MIFFHTEKLTPSPFPSPPNSGERAGVRGDTENPIDRYLGKFERKDWAVSKIPALGEKRQV